MILNNLFYITTKVRGEEQCSHSTSENENDGLTDWLMDPLINRDAFIFSFVFVLFWLQYSNSHTREIEEIWGSLCQFWPNNLKVILRYLVIISGMAPNELLPFVSPFNILFMCSSVWTTQQEHTSLFTCPLQYWGEITYQPRVGCACVHVWSMPVFTSMFMLWISLSDENKHLSIISVISGKTCCPIFGASMSKSIAGWTYDWITNSRNIKLFNWTNRNTTILSFDQHEKGIQPFRW